MYEIFFLLETPGVVLQVEFLGNQAKTEINVQGIYYMQGRMKAGLGRGRNWAAVQSQPKPLYSYTGQLLSG